MIHIVYSIYLVNTVTTQMSRVATWRVFGCPTESKKTIPGMAVFSFLTNMM